MEAEQQAEQEFVDTAYARLDAIRALKPGLLARVRRHTRERLI